VVLNLRFAPCVLGRVRHAPPGDHHGSRRSNRVMRRGLSSARRSATRASSNPFTTGPHTRISFVARVVRQRSWDFRTLRSVPRLRVPAFVIRHTRSLRARPSPPFIPTCRYRIHIAPFIFTAVGRVRVC
jgi:hypothetical protein